MLDLPVNLHSQSGLNVVKCGLAVRINLLIQFKIGSHHFDIFNFMILIVSKKTNPYIFVNYFLTARWSSHAYVRSHATLSMD